MISISEAYTNLRAAKLELYEATEKAISAKLTLEEKKNSLLIGDTITGKNAEVRDAQLSQACWPEMVAVELAEAEKRKAAHEAEIANLIIQEIQWLIQAEEWIGKEDK